MGVVLLEAWGALINLVGNLGIELSEGLWSFFMAYQENIATIYLTYKTSRMLTTLKGLYMSYWNSITLR